MTFKEASMDARSLGLRGDPLPWLLEPDEDNPGVRYLSLRDLLGRPEGDAELAEARGDVMALGPVPAILEAQHPEGYWARPGGGHAPSYLGTVWQIIFLAELGADPGEARVQRGCEYFLNNSVASNGGFSMDKRPVPSSVAHCLHGDPLHALLRLGFYQDSRVQAALDWQVRAIIGGGDIRYYKSGTAGPGFACGYNRGQACAWGATKALKALNALSPDQRTPDVQRAIQVGVDFLLSRDPAVADYPYTERVNTTWFKFSFPLSYRSDVLETTGVLVELGCGKDPRLANALRFILDKADDQGRWKMEKTFNGKMWADIERKGEPSKWVTLRALRVLGGATD
jgi:hypothetical protein